MPGNDAPVPESEVKAGFQAMLEELKVNSRPHLTTLTILAGEYRQFAKQIVGLIETQLNRVRKYKLPIMYLIDSIIKEFPEEYVPIFSTNLVHLFVETFKGQGESRTKMYDLRNTWDDIFAPEILFKLDVTVQQVDKNWPIRVKSTSTAIREHGGASSSDEFSSASAHSDADNQRENSMKKKRKPFSVGFTGSQVAKLAGTPNSSNSPSLNRRKGSKGSISRPPSTASPHGSTDGNNVPRASRYPSLDDRLSMRDSLPDSRVQSSEGESPMSQNGTENGQLVMAEQSTATTNLSPPKHEVLTKSFVPPRSSPHHHHHHHSSSPRHRHAKKVERGIQSKPTSTTREVQTGVFTKTAQTMTQVATKDAQTQKKLRKPKVSHFTHQFNGLKRSQAIQVDRVKTNTVGCQWDEHQSNVAVKKSKKLAKNYEFRQAVTQFRQCDTGRMADSILRRLHDHQKQGQLCDLTILIGRDEEPIRCHKHIVAMVSDVIQVEAMEKEEIYLANIAKDTLTQLIDYCYTAMIGPFVSKEQIEAVCDGVKKLKIRQLDMVVEKLRAGLATGQDYFHSAISGTELISSDIITAAMMGQAIPSQLQSSAGLIDLFDENGFEMPQDSELTPDEEVPEIELDMKAQVKSLPFKKRIVQQDTPSDTDSDSVEPVVTKLRSPRPTTTTTTTTTTPVVVKTPRPVGRPPKNGPKQTPTPTGRPRGRPRLSDSSAAAKNTPKLPKKRNLSEQNDAENAPKVARKSRRSLKSAEIVPDSPVSVLDSLSEAEVVDTVMTTTPSTKKKSRSASPKVVLKKLEVTPKREPKKEAATGAAAVVKKEPKTPKKPSTPAAAATALPKKRKSVLIRPPMLTCPWKTDKTVQENMMLTDRHQFRVNTGHRVQCVYLANLNKKDEPVDDDDDDDDEE